MSESDPHINVEHDSVPGTQRIATNEPDRSVQGNNQNTSFDFKEHWKGIAALCVVLVVAIIVPSVAVDKNKSNNVSTPGNISAPPSSLQTTLTSITSASISSDSAAFSTGSSTVSEGIGSLTSTSLPIIVSQSSPSTITCAVKLSPGVPCTANIECSPNDCYTLPGTATYCCGPTISGCPGWTCAARSDKDCLDPYTCATSGTATCG